MITGFAVKDKYDLIRNLQGDRTHKCKLILFRPTEITFICHPEEPFRQTHLICETVHSQEIHTLPDLITALHREADNEQTEQIILDIYPFTNIDALFSSLVEEPNLFITSHIHVIDARDFWFTYFSEHQILVKNTDLDVISEHTLGELLISQLELADTICLSNTEQISLQRSGELMVFTQTLRPNAFVGSMNEIISRDAEGPTFAFTSFSSLYTMQRNLFSLRGNIYQIGHYDINTYVYHSKLPIDFRRFKMLLTSIPSEVFRMKGKCYDLSQNEYHSISQVGSSIQVETTTIDDLDDVLTEFLFIGSSLNQQELQEMIDACLQTNHQRIAY